MSCQRREAPAGVVLPARRNNTHSRSNGRAEPSQILRTGRKLFGGREMEAAWQAGQAVNANALEVTHCCNLQQVSVASPQEVHLGPRLVTTGRGHRHVELPVSNPSPECPDHQSNSKVLRKLDRMEKRAWPWWFRQNQVESDCLPDAIEGAPDVVRVSFRPVDCAHPDCSCQVLLVVAALTRP